MRFKGYTFYSWDIDLIKTDIKWIEDIIIY